MDIQRLLDNLTEEVSCSVCGDIFKEPKLLPCLHSFCLACLNDLARRAVDGNIQCPLCQRQVAVPDSGTFETLPSSFYINSLLDVLAIKQCSTSEVSCGNCSKKSEDSSYCFHCSMFWCGECLKGHNIFQENKEHRAVVLKDFQAEDYEDVFKRPTICRKKHHHEVLKYYCARCDVAACQTCLNLEHGGHEIEHLDNVSERDKEKIMDQAEKAKCKSKQYAEQIQRNEQESEAIKQRVEAVKYEVNNFADQIIGDIRERQKELVNQAEKMKTIAQDGLAIRNEQLKAQVAKIQAQVSQAENLVLRGTGAEIVTSRKLLELVHEELETQPPDGKLTFSQNSFLVSSLMSEGLGRLENLKTASVKPERKRVTTSILMVLSALAVVLAVSVAFTFPYGGGCAINMLTAEGDGLSEAVTGLEAQFMVTTKHMKGEYGTACYNPKNYRVAVKIKRRQSNEDSLNNVHVEDNKNGTYRVSYFAAEPGDHDVRVTVNGEDVRGSTFPPIHVKPREFKVLMSFGSKGTEPGAFKNPWGVAVNEHGEIAVSDCNNNRVQVFSSEGHLLLTLGGEGNGQGQFDGPRGVTYDGEGNLLVADSRNHRIQQFTRRGQFVSNFGAMEELDEKLNSPHGISSCPNGNIVVADGRKRVVVFSPEGRVLLTLKDDEFYPEHCICHENRFIVSYGRGNCVKVYDEHGKFLYQFGTKGRGNGQFDNSIGLAVDKSGRLVVCDSDNHRFQLFDLDGTFHVRGTSRGEFIEPVSVAVLEDGKFAVTEWGGHRVQIIQ